MGRAYCRLTVFFEDPFWVGVFERCSEGSLSASKVTFGAEPGDYEVQEVILKHYNRLGFSPAVAAAVKEKKRNPKRMQRDAKKLVQGKGIGTRSQQALQMQREEMKTERKQRGKARREAEKERLFHLKQQKRKEKHRGR